MRAYRIAAIIAVPLVSYGLLRGQGLPPLLDAEKARLAVIRKNLDLDNRFAKSRGNAEITVLSFYPESLLPEGFVGELSDGRDSAVSTYIVACRKADVKVGGLEFVVELCRDIPEAQELVLRHFLLNSAPPEYLKKKWAQERVDYGDPSFGRGFWVRGNVVFRVRDAAHEVKAIEEVFSAIDKRITSSPTTRPSGDSVSWRVNHVPDAKAYDIELTNAPAKALIVLRTEGGKASRVGSMKARIEEAKDRPLKEATLVITDASGKAQAFRVELPRSATAPAGPATAASPGTRPASRQ